MRLWQSSAIGGETVSATLADVARLSASAGAACRRLDLPPAAYTPHLIALERDCVLAIIAERRSYVELVRALGTCSVASRRGMTQRTVQRRFSAALAEIVAFNEKRHATTP